VEITLNFYDHPLAAVASDADLFTALTTALDRLHKQALKQRTKWRDGKRKKSNGAVAAPARPERETAAAASVRTQRVYRVNNHERRKPMTLEEAMLEMEQDRDYMVYRDADKDRVRVLVRRADGHFDLIEA
jgi:putative sigma-54 modulation protein